MLIKFETKSNRVKGISFHNTRPWVLASLHSGTIQLWDYRIGSMIDKYEEHEGPVRGIAFHQSQPLFVSGGDDYKIKGWNYKLKKCIFTLTGHLDYIRTVSFHHELPWILSSSDDQTIRIWNYQSRSLISILTGHSHYVMCTQFHPSKNLIVSCSLDQTLRLWDFTNLKKKYTSSLYQKKFNDSISGSEVEIKGVMEGHDRGVNWCSFHPTQNLIVSASDDRKLKIWKYSESKVWEHDVLYGHGHNVSSAVFCSPLDIIVSNSEDKTIRIWDLNKRHLLDTFKREQERFWILAIHPESKLLAAGSDNGMIIFNLVKERIYYQIHNDIVFYIHKKQMKMFELSTSKETVLKDLDYNEISNNAPNSLYYNTHDTSKHTWIISYNNKNRDYLKINLVRYDVLPTQGRKPNELPLKYSFCSSAVFISKGKYAKIRLDKTVVIEDYDYDSLPTSLPGINGAEAIFPGPIGKVIVKSETSLGLYDITNKKYVNEYSGCDASGTKRVVWNNGNSLVALLSKKNLIIMNKQFNKITVLSEKFNIKSAIWIMDSVVIYCTNNHLKYGLVNGDTGILLCIETPFYLLKMDKNILYVITKAGVINNFPIDLDEILFKYYLLNKDSKRIKAMLSSQKKLGNSLISYLFKKNYSSLALTLVENPKAKFSLAIDSGNLEAAFKTCMELKDKESFVRLGDEALRQGNQQLVELAYQNSKSFEKLSFFYLITGNIGKLEKMLYIAQNRGDIMSRFQNAIFLGDIHERIKILAETGQLPLAYMMAALHNIQDMALPLKQSLGENANKIDLNLKSFALIPRKPIIQDFDSSHIASLNWPHYNIVEEDLLLQSKEEDEVIPLAEIKNDLDLDIHEKEEFIEIKEESKNIQNLEEPAETNNDNWGIDDLDIPEIPVVNTNTSKSSGGWAGAGVLNFEPGIDPIVAIGRVSQIAGEQVAIGNFEAALDLLKKQICVINPSPFQPIFTKIYLASSLLLSSPYPTPALEKKLERTNKSKPNEILPNSFVTLQILESELKTAYKNTTEGFFAEAITKFNHILLLITMMSVDSEGEKEEVMALMRICLEYIVGLRCEVMRKQTTDPKRNLELSAYMSSCNLQSSHRVLSLRSSMSLAYKQKNFIYSSFFAKKILRMSDENPAIIKPDVLANIRKVNSACEQQGTNETKIDFEDNMLNDKNIIFSLCAKSLTLINDKTIKKCPFDGSRYKNIYDGQVCEVCQVCKIGGECLGLKIN